jgi:transcriptional regulator with XRE-family HTH domain
MSRQTDTEDIGQRVEARRSELGIPVERLAAEATIPATTLIRRLAGDGRLTVAELGRLSTALGVSASSWFEEAA